MEGSVFSAVANDLIYFGSGTIVYALDAGTGALVWRYVAQGNPYNAAFSSPTVANGMVYFTGEDSNVYALNAATDALIWTTSTGDRSATYLFNLTYNALLVEVPRWLGMDRPHLGSWVEKIPFCHTLYKLPSERWLLFSVR